MSAVASIERELRAGVAADVVAPTAQYLADETEGRGIRGRADAIALPKTAAEVAEVLQMRMGQEWTSVRAGFRVPVTVKRGANWGEMA